MKTKRRCKVCGNVHLNCPFTDCYAEKTLPDDLQDYYSRKFGEED